MITGTHAIIYASDAERARAFFRDVLDLPYVDAHDGWLIFRLPPSELGVHPADAPSHELSLMCDDLAATMEELRAKGIEFVGEPEPAGFGVTVMMKLPGGVQMMLYEPRHPTAI